MPNWFYSGRTIAVVLIALVAFAYYASTKPVPSEASDPTPARTLAHVGGLKEGVTSVLISGRLCVIAQGYATNNASSISIDCV